MQTEKEIDYKEVRKKLIEDNKLTLKADFIPFSQSCNNGKEKGRDKWESLNWNITLLKDSRIIVRTDYSQGVAHCPAYKKPIKNSTGTKDSYWSQKALEFEIENGRVAQFLGYGSGFRGREKIPAPDVESVLYSLVMDSDVLDSSGFENWASDYGYDTDSIKANETYQQCLEIALKLRAGLGNALLLSLREAYQDY